MRFETCIVTRFNGIRIAYWAVWTRIAFSNVDTHANAVITNMNRTLNRRCMLVISQPLIQSVRVWHYAFYVRYMNGVFLKSTHANIAFRMCCGIQPRTPDTLCSQPNIEDIPQFSQAVLRMTMDQRAWIGATLFHNHSVRYRTQNNGRKV